MLLKNYSEHDVVETLNRNKIKVDKKTILLREYIGLKLWGMIDFLRSKCGYIAILSNNKTK